MKSVLSFKLHKIFTVLCFTSFVKYWGFPGGSDSKDSACNAGDLGSIPGLGKSPGVGTFSSILAWRIPWTEEAGRLQSMGHKELDTTEGLTLNCVILTMFNSKIRFPLRILE